MSLHVEYECIYVFVSFEVFFYLFYSLEAVDLDEPFGLSLSLHHSDFN